jgi:hypothetical protein
MGAVVRTARSRLAWFSIVAPVALVAAGGIAVWVRAALQTTTPPFRLVLVDETREARRAVASTLQESVKLGGPEIDLSNATLNRLVTTEGVTAELDKLLFAGDLEAYLVLAADFAETGRARLVHARPPPEPIARLIHQAAARALTDARLARAGIDARERARLTSFAKVESVGKVAPAPRP